MVDNPNKKLPDSNVFSRDPEDWTNESLEEAAIRLKKILDRIGKVKELGNES